MRRFDRDPFRMWRLTWWQAALLAAVAIAAVLAVAIVATSLILIIAPIILVTVLVHRLLAGRRSRDHGSDPRAHPRIIDADYEIVSVERRTDDGGQRPRRE